METSTFPSDQPTRPQFLKVLCILSFIGIGIMLLISLFGINKTFIQSAEEKIAVREQTVAQVLQMNPEADEEKMNEVLLEAEKYEKSNWLIGVGCNILTLLGVIMMWQLKKTGFYLYTAGELLTYILPMIFNGLDSFRSGMAQGEIWGGTMAKIGMGVFICVIVFDLLFIVLYSLNLKHLKS